MKLVKVSLIRLIVMGVSMIAFMGILWGCSSSSSSSGNSVASAIGGLPSAQLSASQSDSIVVTVLQQIIPSSPIADYSIAGDVITNEAESADPFYLYNNYYCSLYYCISAGSIFNNYNSTYYLTNVTPTTISGAGLQQNGGSYLTDVTLSWVNAKNTYYDQYNSLENVTETDNGALKEHGTYSYAQGSAAILENAKLNSLIQYADGSQEQDSNSYSASWNAQGFIPGSQSFSLNNTFNGNGSVSAHYTPASNFTDYTTGYKLSDVTASGWSAYNYNLTGTMDSLNYNENDGGAYNENGTVFSSTSGTMTIQSVNGQVISLQEQFSGTTFTISGNAILGEMDEEKINGQVVSQPPTPPDFSGKVTVTINNLIFDNSFCYGQQPSNGTITVNFYKNVYTYDFSVNSTGNNCGCANVSVNGGNPTLDCNIYSAQPVYLSLSSLHGAKSQPRFKSPFGQLFLKK